eukprot:6170383-Amphidinium_carterae.1
MSTSQATAPGIGKYFKVILLGFWFDGAFSPPVQRCFGKFCTQNVKTELKTSHNSTTAPTHPAYQANLQPQPKT